MSNEEKKENQCMADKKILIERGMCDIKTSVIINDKIESISLTHSGSGWYPSCAVPDYQLPEEKITVL